MNSEIFAFGSALYYMVFGRDLWPELDYVKDREEMARRIRERVFPDIEGLRA